MKRWELKEIKVKISNNPSNKATEWQFKQTTIQFKLVPKLTFDLTGGDGRGRVVEGKRGNTNKRRLAASHAPRRPGRTTINAVEAVHPINLTARNSMQQCRIDGADIDNRLII